MSIESDVSQILNELEPKTLDDDLFGIEAGRLADGIRQSGLLSELAGFRSDVGDGLLAIASVMGVATREIVARIAESNSYLKRVAEALESPRSTAATELRRRAAEAIQNEWFDDAVNELEASIENDRFAATSYLLLATALQGVGRRADAIEALTSAMKYVRPSGPGAITGCALTAAAMLSEAEEREAAIRVLQAVADEFPSCAEVALKLGVLAGDNVSVERALRLEPGLAVIAMAVAPELTHRAIGNVLNGHDGLASRFVRLRNVVAELRALSGRPMLNIFAENVDEFETYSPAKQWLVATEFLTAINSIIADARDEVQVDDAADRAATKEELERLRWDFSSTERPVAAAAASRSQARAEALQRLEEVYSRPARVHPWQS